ncbi:hypothetical protein JXVLWARM_CDS_0110 [Burkholderia phage Bm1]
MAGGFTTNIDAELFALSRREENLRDAPQGTPEQEDKIAQQLDAIGKRRAELLALKSKGG